MVKRVSLVFFLFFIGVYIFPKTAEDLVKEAKSVIKEITPEQADSIIKSGGVVIIDVREPLEFQEGRIKGTILIPRGVLEFEIEKKVPDRNTKIIVYCKKGGRGALAALTLSKMEYKNVFNIQGGIVAWEAKGLPVEK